MSSSSPSLSKPPRRVPPPCWTHDETLALIDSYHHRWHSLGRGNLKASHWQQVADSLAARCPLPSPAPPKTATQCRHKIEKLRKRYRSEKQRASASALPNRFFSSWNFFKKMDDLERGPPPPHPHHNQSDDDDDNQDDASNDDEDLEDEENENIMKCRINSSPSNFGGGFRFRVPVGSGSASSMRPPPKYNNFNTEEFDGSLAHRYNPNSTPNPRPLPNSASRPPHFNNGVKREREREMEMDPMAEMISSIRMLGEGYVRMEERKLEMEREMEQMRMEMEMKRTQMILESQQRIVEAFASGASPGNKKMKRMPPSPES